MVKACGQKPGHLGKKQKQNQMHWSAEGRKQNGKEFQNQFW